MKAEKHMSKQVYRVIFYQASHLLD